MANEAEEQKVRAKKKTEEDQIHEIIWTSLAELQSNVQALNKAIDFNEENPRKLAILINARARIQQQILLLRCASGKSKAQTDDG